MAVLEAVRRPISALPIVARIPIAGSPDWVGIGSQAVWISNKATGSIARIDPLTNRVAAVVRVGRAPCSGLGIGFGSVWVPSCQDQRLDRVDEADNRVVASIPVHVPDSEGGIAVDDRGVWMLTDTDGMLSHIDPASNRVTDQFRTAPGSFVPTSGSGALWLTSTQGNFVCRVDPTMRRVVARIPVGRSPRFLVAAEGAVWVLNQDDGTVSRIDPQTNRVTATIDVGVPGPGGDIAAGAGHVWVTAINVPLTKIDPVTNRVTAQFVGRGGDALRVGHEAIWLCSFFLEEVWRVELSVS